VKIRIFALFFGDYYDLHDRLVTGLENTHGIGDTELRVWLNDVSPKCSARIKKCLVRTGGTIEYEGKNVPKYHAMRRMFEPLKRDGDQLDWVVWFDDDTNIYKPDWIDVTKKFITDKITPVYIGEKWFIHWRPGQWDFIQKATWYKEKPSELIKGRPGVNFAQGAYWWLRVPELRQLDWPDPRLSHNGGDTLLGEAIYQQGWPFHVFNYGVKPNDAKRRGLSERPAGDR